MRFANREEAARLLADRLADERDRNPLVLGVPRGAVLKGRYFDIASDEYMRGEIRAQQEILRKRRELYTRAHPAIDPAGRVVIIVDAELRRDHRCWRQSWRAFRRRGA